MLQGVHDRKVALDRHRDLVKIEKKLKTPKPMQRIGIKLTEIFFQVFDEIVGSLRTALKDT